MSLQETSGETKQSHHVLPEPRRSFGLELQLCKRFLCKGIAEEHLDAQRSTIVIPVATMNLVDSKTKEQKKTDKFTATKMQNHPRTLSA